MNCNSGSMKSLGKSWSFQCSDRRVREAILRVDLVGMVPIESCRREKLEEEEGLMSKSIILTALLKMCLVYSEWIEGSSSDSDRFCDNTLNFGFTNTEVGLQVIFDMKLYQLPN